MLNIILQTLPSHHGEISVMKSVICSQDIERKPNSDVNQGRNSVANLQKKMTLYNPKIDLVNDNVYSKCG